MGWSPSAVNSVAFSPDGTLLASASDDGQVRLWDVKSEDLVPRLDHGIAAWRLAFSPDGNQLACANFALSVKIWSMTPETSTTLVGNRSSWNEVIGLEAVDIVCSLAFSPDGSWLAGGLNDGRVQVWGNMQSESTLIVEGDGTQTWGLAFSPDGKWLAFSSLTTAIWIQDMIPDVSSGTFSAFPAVAKLDEHTARTTSVAFSLNTRWMASGADDETIIIRNVSSWTRFAILQSRDIVASLAFSPDSTQLASGTGGGDIQIWDLSSEIFVMILQGHSAWIREVAFSPNGKQLASASTDGTTRLWQMVENVHKELEGDKEEEEEEEEEYN